MSSTKETSTAGRTTGSSWRPSAREHSSRAYTGSFTAEGASRRPAQTTRPPLRRLLPAFGLGLALLAAGAGLYFGLDRDRRPAPVIDAAAVVELARGPVQLVLPASGPGESPTRMPARPGLELPAGAVIDTGDRPANEHGESAGVALRLTGGASARFDAGSRAVLRGPGRVELQRGAVYVDSRQGAGEGARDGESVEVRTTFGLVRDIGTQFEVRLVGEGEASEGDDVVAPSAEDTAGGTAEGGTAEGARNDDADAPALRIRVREGQVLYANAAGDEHRAAAGEELRVLASGAVERSNVPVYGPHWRWVLTTAPVPEVEGRPLSVFLDWLEREGGWSLRYEEPSRPLAEETTLFGTIHGLSADEATPMVFAGSGLVYRLEDEELIISKRR